MTDVVTFINVPGYTNSGPDHWHSLWEKENTNFIRVQQRDWNAPVCNEWTEQLQKTIHSVKGPVVLVGHSIGSNTIVHWAQRYKTAILGALLVTPDAPDGPIFPKEVSGYSSIPFEPLPFKSILVCSSNDLYLSVHQAEQFANCWGSELINIGAHGHINTASGLKDWSDGKKLLEKLLGFVV